MKKKPFLKPTEVKFRSLRTENLRYAMRALDKALALAEGQPELVHEIECVKLNLSMSDDFGELSYHLTDDRRAKEYKGSERGVEMRRNGDAWTVADILDELRKIYNPNEAGDWHRRELAKIDPTLQRSVRTVERYLKKIRENY